MVLPTVLELIFKKGGGEFWLHLLVWIARHSFLVHPPLLCVRSSEDNVNNNNSLSQ